MRLKGLSKLPLRSQLVSRLSPSQSDGFTLIELLVVIIIIGILAAIALPSFLNQANKAKQSEAKAYVGTMNRAQQAYFLERNQFAPQSHIDQLGLGIDTVTLNYTYGIATNVANVSYVINIADPIPDTLRAYVGPTKVGTTSTGEGTTLTTLCEGIKTPIEGGNRPNLDGSGLTLSNFGLGTSGVITCDASIYDDIGQ